MPRMPDFVSTDVAAEFWRTYGPPCNRLGLLESLDAPAYGMLSETFSLLQQLRDAFAEDGRLTIAIGENGAEQPNPLLGEIAKQTKAILALLSEFGMTPVSRQKLTGSTSAEPVDPNADPMAALFAAVSGPGGAPPPPPPEPAQKPTAKRKPTPKRKPKKKAAAKSPARKRR